MRREAYGSGSTKCPAPESAGW